MQIMIKGVGLATQDFIDQVAIETLSNEPTQQQVEAILHKKFREYVAECRAENVISRPFNDFAEYYGYVRS